MAKQKLNKQEAKTAAKALEILFTTEYVSKHELYKQNFIRGLFFSAGTFIGAALILGAGVWVLSLFDQVPIVGPAFERIIQSIESTK